MQAKGANGETLATSVICGVPFPFDFVLLEKFCECTAVFLRAFGCQADIAAGLRHQPAKVTLLEILDDARLSLFESHFEGTHLPAIVWIPPALLHYGFRHYGNSRSLGKKKLPVN